MKTPILLSALVAAAFGPAGARDNDPEAVDRPAAGGLPAVAAAKRHVRSIITGDFDRLRETYAARVTLMPGHEFLKPEYGIAGLKGRAEAAEVERARLLVVAGKAHEGRGGRELEQSEKLIESLAFQSLEAGEGEHRIDPEDPVATPDGGLHFTLREGDALIRVAPERGGRGDAALFQFRLIGGVWQVIAEYLD